MYASFDQPIRSRILLVLCLHMSAYILAQNYIFESDLLLQFLFYLVYSQSLNKITFLTAFLTSSLDSANSAFNRKVPPLPSSRISPKVKKPFVIKNLYVKPNREENCVKQTKASHRNQILAKKQGGNQQKFPFYFRFKPNFEVNE